MVRPRANNYQERRSEILDAAASIFAERGFDGTSTSAIALKCGVSKALLYHYFASKEEILFEMLVTHCQFLVASAQRALRETDSGEEQLASVVGELISLYMSSQDKHIALMNNLKSLSEEQQKEIKKLERTLVQIIKGIVARLRPELSEPVQTSLAMYLMGAINWTYTWFKPDGPVSSGQFAQLASSMFLNGLKSAIVPS
ncbi:TetR/AcrR family transcriptional regulator [soil metagenome]